jgi:hypothetical protein
MNEFAKGHGVVLGPEEGESVWQPRPSTGYIINKLTPYNTPYDSFSMGIQVLEPGAAEVHSVRRGVRRTMPNVIASRRRSNPDGSAHSPRDCLAGSSPIGIRIRTWVDANVLSPVMPGLDPGIRPSTAAAIDGRVKPGHDLEGTVPPDRVLPADALMLMPMGSSPATAALLAMTPETTRYDRLGTRRGFGPSRPTTRRRPARTVAANPTSAT